MEKKEYNPGSGQIHTISIARANFIAVILMLPEILIFALPFFLIWGENVFSALRFQSLLFLFLFIVVGVAVHELLHGLTWAIVTRTGFRYIRFGVKWEFLTPYCHYIEAMHVWQYIAGGIAPLIFMGIIPAIWALFNGDVLMMFYGMFFTWAAGGDIQAIWMLRKFSSRQLVYDHPEELGFIIKDN